MKSIGAVAAGSLLASVASAQVVQWNIERRDTHQSVPRVGRRQQSGTYEEVITNEKLRGGYFATTSIGTPAQNLTLQLDTGSSDIWVPANSASVCTQSTKSAGCSFGSFNYRSSTSFVRKSAGSFSISYVDGSHSKGDYFTDNFEIGGAKLTNVTMGLGLDTDIPYGLVGVGYASNEAIVGQTSGRTEYDNLPVQMMNENMIATNAYSLWLNDLDASTGNILFGGIDTEKYKGDLARVSILKEKQTNAFTSFVVPLTTLSAYSSSGSDALSSASFPIDVVLDSGTTMSYLPNDLAAQVWTMVGAVYSTDVDVAVLPCSMETSKGFFSFQFGGTGGPVINVTMDELVLPITTGDAPKFSSGKYKGQEACQFGIQNFSSDPFLLGDTFLRSAYVVYDLINNEIGIAPTDFNATKSNVVAFPSKGATIPSSTPAPNQDKIAASANTQKPAYAAQSGFGTTSGVVGMPAALDLGKLSVIGASMFFTMVGSGAFLLF